MPFSFGIGAHALQEEGFFIITRNLRSKQRRKHSPKAQRQNPYIPPEAAELQGLYGFVGGDYRPTEIMTDRSGFVADGSTEVLSFVAILLLCSTRRWGKGGNSK